MRKRVLPADARCEKCSIEYPLEIHHEYTKRGVKRHILCRKHHQEIHGLVPIIDELTSLCRQYDKINKLIVMFKNWRTSYEKEFGDSPIDLPLDDLLEKKKALREEILGMNKHREQLFSHVKGIGGISLARLVAYAHPRRFPTLQRFLIYCGLTGLFKETMRANRKAKSALYMMANNVITNRDEKYYSLYLKIKKDLKSKYPNDSKGRLEMRVRNRIATFIAKEVWYALKDEGSRGE